MFECQFGVPMCGAVLNAINMRLDAPTIAFMLDHGEAKVLITDREFSQALGPALSMCEARPLVIDVDRGHRIAATDATLREGRGELAAAGVGLGPGEAAVHVEERRPPRTGRGAPVEELERRERGEVCGILVEPDVIWTGHKGSPSLESGSKIQRYLSKLV